MSANALPTYKPKLDLFTGSTVGLFCECRVNLALVATRFGVGAAMSAARVPALLPFTAFLVRLMLVPEIVGTAVVLVGMSYFWLGFDRSGYAKRALWLVLVYFFGLFALPFYYFLDYRRLLSVGTDKVPVSAPATV